GRHRPTLEGRIDLGPGGPQDDQGQRGGPDDQRGQGERRRGPSNVWGGLPLVCDDCCGHGCLLLRNDEGPRPSVGTRALVPPPSSYAPLNSGGTGRVGNHFWKIFL